MNDEPRFNDKLTVKEYYIAVFDEIELEASVWKERSSTEEALKKYRDAEHAALREIERLKLSGEYEAERARLAAALPSQTPKMQRFASRIEAGEFESFFNFYKGMRSADPEQRERFERLYREADLADKTPREFWHILDCLEKGKKPKGRPGASPPWRNVVSALDEMRLAVADGVTIPQAAREAAAKEGRAEQDSRARYFEKLYRQRAALRE